MGIAKQHFYHGAALMQIVEHEAFNALNKATGAYGHYAINHDVRLHVKYSTSETRTYNFQFDKDELKRLRDDHEAKGWRVFATLVCNNEGVCVIRMDEMMQLMDIEGDGGTVVVTAEPGRWFGIRCGGLDLNRRIPRTAFPKRIFE